MHDDINTKRTELANDFAAIGAANLDFNATAAVLAAIPDTEPQQYVAAGTPENIAAILPATICPQRRLRHGERLTEALAFDDATQAQNGAELDLQQLKALALAADQGEGQHIYTNQRDSNGWQANYDFHRAASPAVVLDLIARIERTQQGFELARANFQLVVEKNAELRARIERATAPHGSAAPTEAAPVVCTLPPTGWRCTRAPRHEGPCAAVPTEICADDYTPEQQVIYQHGVEDGKLIARSMARFNAGRAAAPVSGGDLSLQQAAQLVLDRYDELRGERTAAAEFEILRAAVSASQAAPVGGGWLPIESAPRDGSQIMLSNGVNVAQGWYVDDPVVGTEVKRDTEGRYVDEVYHEGYQGWLDCEGGMQPDPSHWMPLPFAPGSTAVGAATVPTGDYVMMPKRLTAENGAKAAMIGEFYEEITVRCPDCDGGNDDLFCASCNDEGTVQQPVQVQWDTIKQIYTRAVELLAAPVEQGQGALDAQLRQEVAIMYQMLDDGEWAEHLAVTPHGQCLETAITRLIGRAAPMGAGVVPEEAMYPFYLLIDKLLQAWIDKNAEPGRRVNARLELEAAISKVLTPTAATAHPVAADDQVRDAKRYRAWRSALVNEDTAFVEKIGEALPNEISENDRMPTADEWDAAIDAAILSRTTAHGGAQGEA